MIPQVHSCYSKWLYFILFNGWVIFHYVCVYTYICRYIYIYIHTCMYIHTVYMCVCVYIPLIFPWRRAWQPSPVFLPGESSRTKEPGGLQRMGHRASGVTEHRPGHTPPLDALLCQWTFGFPCLGRGKQCCSEHCGACVLLGCVFLWIYAQEWDWRVTW